MLWFLLFIFVGLVIGLVGGGGGIFAIPVLVYVLHIDPLIAIFYSMMLVGTTSLVGTMIARKYVEWKMSFLFGIPSILATIAMRRWGVPALPDMIFGIEKWEALLIIFALVMVGSSCAILCKKKKLSLKKSLQKNTARLFTIFQGVMVGSLTGLVGAGGGFLIVPALILFGGLEGKRALVTSMWIISMNTLLGALGHIPHGFDRIFLLSMIAFSLFGLVIGLFLQKKIHEQHLAHGFAILTMTVGIVMIGKEIFF